MTASARLWARKHAAIASTSVKDSDSEDRTPGRNAVGPLLEVHEFPLSSLEHLVGTIRPRTSRCRRKGRR